MRYFAALFVFFALLGGTPVALAQTPDYSECYNTSNIGTESPVTPLCPTRQVAYEQGIAACNAYVASYGQVGQCAVNSTNVAGKYYRFRHPPTNGFTTYRAWAVECSEGSVWNEAGNTCNEPCDPNAPPLTGGFMSYTGSEPGYQTCSDGCEYNPSSMTYQTGMVDGIKYVSLAGWIPSGASCTVGPNDGYVPPLDSDGDGISDSYDNAPFNPGDSSSPNDPDKPKGETNNDGDGSGNGNQSSGGGSCDAPPSSSGDGILAQIAYQAWATRCAIERSKDANGNLRTTGGQNGTGQTPGGGSTDMTETNGLLSAIKGFVKRISDFIDGITGEVGGLDTDKGQGEDDLATVWGDAPEEEELDAGGLGWGRTCPQLPSISLGGYSGQVDDGSLCTVMQAVGALILLLAYFQAGLIIGRS